MDVGLAVAAGSHLLSSRVMVYSIDFRGIQPPKGATIPNPPGYPSAASSKDVAAGKKRVEPAPAWSRQATELKIRRAWDLAFSPAKQLPMQAIMLYMSGSGVQIFSLGIVFMLLISPFSAVFGILRAFEPFRPTPPPRATNSKNAEPQAPSYKLLLPPMAMYILCQCLVLALGLWKCSAMGLLPTGTSDWLQFETRDEAPEWSAVRLKSLG